LENLTRKCVGTTKNVSEPRGGGGKKRRMGKLRSAGRPAQNFRGGERVLERKREGAILMEYGKELGKNGWEKSWGRRSARMGLARGWD